MLRTLLIAMLALVGFAHAQDGELRVLLSSQLTTLAPFDTTDTDSAAVRYSIYNGLLTMTESGTPEPDLATSWTISDDGLRYDFALRQGVVFHDGTPFNAEAVRASFAYLLRDGNNTSASAYFRPYVSSIEVVDEFTVRFTLQAPFAPFLNYLAHPAAHIASPAALERYGDSIGENPVGTGPFKFVEWVRGDHLILERFDDYYGPRPGVARIVYRVVPEAATRMALLETGEADLILRVSPDEAQQLEGNPDVRLETTITARVIYFALNMNRPPLDDVRVRQAINHAVNVRGIIDALFGPDIPQADSPIAPTVYGYAPTKTYDYDPQLARELLAEAGVDPSTVTLSIWSPNGRYVQDATMAQAVAQQLQEFGFKVDLRIFGDFAEFNQVSFTDSRGDLNLYGWAPGTLEAEGGMYQILHGDRANVFGNNAGYNSEAFNTALVAARTLTTEADKLAAYAEVQRIVMEDAPWLFLDVQPVITAMATGVEGVYLLPSEHLILRTASKR